MARTWSLAALAGIFAIALVALPTLWLLRLDDPVAELERLMAAWGPLAALASIGLMVLHSFVPFPAEMLAIANGMLFGPVWGTVVTWSGAMLGAFLALAWRGASAGSWWSGWWRRATGRGSTP